MFGLVFTTEIGTPVDGSNLTRLFQRRLATLELPRQRFHDLRHACASLLLAEGVPLKTIQDVLGHSQSSLTADTYAHLAPTLPRDAATALDRALSQVYTCPPGMTAQTVAAAACAPTVEDFDIIISGESPQTPLTLGDATAGESSFT